MPFSALALFCIHKSLCKFIRRLLLFRLQLQKIAQRLKPLFFGNHCTRAALGTVRPINILQFSHGGSVVQCVLKFLSPHFEFGKRRSNFLPARIQCTQLFQSFRNFAQLLVIQFAVLFFSISRNKGQRVSFIQKSYKDTCKRER